MLEGLSPGTKGLLAGDFKDFHCRLTKTAGCVGAKSGGEKVRHWVQALVSMRIRVMGADLVDLSHNARPPHASCSFLT